MSTVVPTRSAWHPVRLAQRGVRGLSALINAALFVALFALFMVGSYAIWDTSVVFAEAEPTQWQAYQPVGADTASFADLRAQNSEVIAWLDVYGTNINYPVVHSATSDTKYLDHDALGNYSFSGAIYLEASNQPDFSDFSSVVYGHHMEHDAMFGEIGNFKDSDYFQERPFGTLFISDGTPQGGTLHGLEFFAYLDANAYDASVYWPDVADNAQRQEYVEHLLSMATQTRDVAVEPADHIVLLSTCASGGGPERSILVGKITDQIQPNSFEKPQQAGPGADLLTGYLGFPWLGWIALGAFLCLMIAWILVWGSRRRERKTAENLSV